MDRLSLLISFMTETSEVIVSEDLEQYAKLDVQDDDHDAEEKVSYLIVLILDGNSEHVAHA